MFKHQPKPRTWGFRFSIADTAAIAVFASAVFILRELDSQLSWMLAIAAGHFFLFCNVFRIVRRRELIWAGIFILNVAIWGWLNQLTGLRVFICQLPFTVVLILADIRGRGYHGILADRLNPNLNDYLEGRVS